VCRQVGHVVTYIHSQSLGLDYENTLRKIKQFRPDIVVLYIQHIKAPVDFKIANFVKKKLNAAVIGVGPFVSGIPGSILNVCPSIDAVTISEFDYTISDIADALSKGKPLSSVPGIMVRNKGVSVLTSQRPLITDLDALPFPAFDLVDIPKFYETVFLRSPTATTITCYDDKTEVLTKNGWKFFKDISKADKIATLNSKNFELQYQKPIRIIEANYSGKMIRVKSEQLDMLVTPNHELFVRKQKKNKFEMMYANSLNKSIIYEFKKDAIWKGKEEDFFVLPSVNFGISKYSSKLLEPLKIPMDLWLEFLGYYLSEGYIYHKKEIGHRGYHIGICQTRAVHPNKFKKIESCLERMKKYGIKFISTDYRFYAYSKQLFVYLKQFGKASEKYIPRDIKSLSTRQLEILYNSLMVGDGCLSRNSYFSMSKLLIDDVQEILLKINSCGNIKRDKRWGVYSIVANQKKLTPSIKNYGKYKKRKYIEKVNYSGKIYCCEVPNHIIYVRRNGKPVWSGNSRGCPYNCVFCSYRHVMYSNKFRAQSPERVLDEVRYLQNNFGVREIRYDDDTFEVNKKRVMEICNLFRKEKIDLMWSAQSRANHMSNELCKTMHRAGCERLLFGVESGNERVLKMINKGETLQQIRDGIKCCRKNNITAHNCFMVGFYWDTKESIEDTIRFAFELKSEIAQISIATPLPGTPYYELLKSKNLLIGEDWTRDSFRHAGIKHPTLTAEEIEKYALSSYSRYYLRLGYVPIAASWVLRRPERIKQLYIMGSAFLKRVKERWV